MILETLSRALKEQNWLAVVIEFVIVVSGVLLAFQISTWNTESSEQAYARDILGRLHAELLAVGGVRAASAERRAERLAILLEARPIVMGVSEVDALSPEHCDAIALSHLVGPAPDAFPSLDELMGSGALKSIESLQVRNAAMELYSKRSAVRSSAEQSTSRVMNLPIAYPESINSTLVRNPLDEEDAWRTGAACDLAVMRRSNSFQAALLENIAWYRYNLSFVYLFLDEAIETLREAIEVELGLAPIDADVSPSEDDSIRA